MKRASIQNTLWNVPIPTYWPTIQFFSSCELVLTGKDKWIMNLLYIHSLSLSLYISVHLSIYLSTSIELYIFYMNFPNVASLLSVNVDDVDWHSRSTQPHFDRITRRHHCIDIGRLRQTEENWYEKIKIQRFTADEFWHSKYCWRIELINIKQNLPIPS